MLQVNVESVLLAERFLDRCKKVFIQIHTPATSVANKVVMMAFLSMVVDVLVTHFVSGHPKGARAGQVKIRHLR
jgi:hypothetical protein